MEERLDTLRRELNKKIAKARPLVEQVQRGELRVLSEDQQRHVDSYEGWLADLELVKKGQLPADKDENSNINTNKSSSLKSNVSDNGTTGYNKQAPAAAAAASSTAAEEQNTNKINNAAAEKAAAAAAAAVVGNHQADLDETDDDAPEAWADLTRAQLIRRLHRSPKPLRKAQIEAYVARTVPSTDLVAYTRKYEAISQLRRDAAKKSKAGGAAVAGAGGQSPAAAAVGGAGGPTEAEFEAARQALFAEQSRVRKESEKVRNGLLEQLAALEKAIADAAERDAAEKRRAEEARQQLAKKARLEKNKDENARRQAAREQQAMEKEAESAVPQDAVQENPFELTDAAVAAAAAAAEKEAAAAAAAALKKKHQQEEEEAAAAAAQKKAEEEAAAAKKKKAEEEEEAVAAAAKKKAEQAEERDKAVATAAASAEAENKNKKMMAAAEGEAETPSRTKKEQREKDAAAASAAAKKDAAVAAPVAKDAESKQKKQQQQQQQTEEQPKPKPAPVVAADDDDGDIFGGGDMFDVDAAQVAAEEEKQRKKQKEEEARAAKAAVSPTAATSTADDDGAMVDGLAEETQTVTLSSSAATFTAAKPVEKKELDWSVIAIERNRALRPLSPGPAARGSSSSIAGDRSSSRGPASASSVAAPTAARPVRSVKSGNTFWVLSADNVAAAPSSSAAEKSSGKSGSNSGSSNALRIQDELDTVSANLPSNVAVMSVGAGNKWRINVAPRNGPLAGYVVPLLLSFSAFFPFEAPVLQVLVDMPSSHPLISNTADARNAVLLAPPSSSSSSSSSGRRGNSNNSAANRSKTSLSTGWTPLSNILDIINLASTLFDAGVMPSSAAATNGQRAPSAGRGGQRSSSVSRSFISTLSVIESLRNFEDIDESGHRPGAPSPAVSAVYNGPLSMMDDASAAAALQAPLPASASKSSSSAKSVNTEQQRGKVLLWDHRYGVGKHTVNVTRNAASANSNSNSVLIGVNFIVGGRTTESCELDIYTGELIKNAATDAKKEQQHQQQIQQQKQQIDGDVTMEISVEKSGECSVVFIGSSQGGGAGKSLGEHKFSKTAAAAGESPVAVSIAMPCLVAPYIRIPAATTSSAVLKDHLSLSFSVPSPANSSAPGKKKDGAAAAAAATAASSAPSAPAPLRCAVTGATLSADVVLGIGAEVTRATAGTANAADSAMGGIVAIRSSSQLVSSSLFPRLSGVKDARGTRLDVFVPLLLDSKLKAKTMPLLRAAVMHLTRRTVTHYAPPFVPAIAARACAMLLDGCVSDLTASAPDDEEIVSRYIALFHNFAALAAEHPEMTTEATKILAQWNTPAASSNGIGSAASPGLPFAYACVTSTITWQSVTRKALGSLVKQSAKATATTTTPTSSSSSDTAGAASSSSSSSAGKRNGGAAAAAAAKKESNSKIPASEAEAFRLLSSQPKLFAHVLFSAALASPFKGPLPATSVEQQSSIAPIRKTMLAGVVGARTLVKCWDDVSEHTGCMLSIRDVFGADE